MKRRLLFLASHLAAVAIGFALGVYTLPILIAPATPTAAELHQLAGPAQWTARFHRDLRDSDALHWGEGTVSVGPKSIRFEGRLAPGPDYKLYLAPEFVETEAAFRALQHRMVRVGDVKTFDGFLVAVPDGVDPAQHTTVIVWCEAFGQFITAAKYR